MSFEITVLMPVYNAAPFLALAIESILGQSYRGFEFLVVDDGSTDGSAAILADYARRDSRMRVLSKPNGGMASALNLGLSEARGSLIARMDADDIAVPARLARQHAFLEAHPRVGICGGFMRLIGGGSGVRRVPCRPEDACARLLFHSPLAHPTVMLRREALASELPTVYRAEYDPSDDYDLWTRLAGRCQIASLPEVLLLYRIHGQQLSVEGAERASGAKARIRLTRLGQLGIDPSPEEQQLHQALSDGRYLPDKAFVAAAEAWLLRLLEANRRARLYQQEALAREIAWRFRDLVGESACLGPWAWSRFVRSRLSQLRLSEAALFARFTLRCALAALRK